tara:strand:+ start:386 stop:649 length:264 start_codon:yes stop_codon:yes gene_type:complete
MSNTYQSRATSQTGQYVDRNENVKKGALLGLAGGLALCALAPVIGPAAVTAAIALAVVAPIAGAGIDANDAKNRKEMQRIRKNDLSM